MPQATEQKLRQLSLVGSRRELVDILRCGAMTVDRLAAATGLTTRAVRAQLTLLERDGIVRAGAVRRGAVGKPAIIYEIDEHAEPLLSRAYPVVLSAAVATLADRRNAASGDAALRALGHRLAQSVEWPRAPTLAKRVTDAARLLRSWGGLIRVRTTPTGYRMRACGCPISAAVRTDSRVCLVLETMLADLLGTGVQECCDRNGRPSCCFEIAGNGTASASQRRVATAR